jgi:hypothetical protein
MRDDARLAFADTTTAAAPSTATATSAETGDRATAFRAVTGNSETVNGGALLVAAYAFVWIVVMIVIARIFTRQTSVAGKLDALDAEVKKALTTKVAR